MRSSYAANNYNELLGALTSVYKPSSILEIGILDGFSLRSFADAAPDAMINAFDLFDGFVGNHSNETKIRQMFADRSNVVIQQGDFFELHKMLENEQWDFIHIDVANDGAVYNHAFLHYLPLVSQGGLLLLEGGTVERDQVEWMKKYNKPPIQPGLAASGLPYFTFQPFPGLTVIHK